MKGVFHFSFIIITQPNGIFQDSSSLFPLKANKKSAPLDLSHPSKKAQRTDQPPKPRTQEPPRHRQTAVRYMEAAVFALLLGLSVASAAAPYDPPTVPELMDRFGLPRALLPETARRYLLHDDGTDLPRRRLRGRGWGLPRRLRHRGLRHRVPRDGHGARGRPRPRAVRLGAHHRRRGGRRRGHCPHRPNQEVVPRRRVQIESPVHHRIGGS